MSFLSFEELPKKEQPDKSIWFDAKLMDEHWERVTRSREAQAKGEPDEYEIEGPVSHNRAVDSLIV